ncbi:MAG: pseudouridine synthase [Zymomonas mobilis subsp. pomaceae]|uniref:Pseudouridine synthase n=1 Tax=Zymomonas mobilis subsp. pomaceae (strain ATCC 29192 / DSM 22645 / JCM 10191 / CCUG 17912 / NBRC 13757 / NCIMB 11200 / NRRL B-4491 / Barker I) TaxID=579138 RepID=F8ERT4_ZYMMT|nr:pseudouridine synthase [Zymomonas mobilis]AEI37542.1 pseudouridine synthase [Zymomonas mobilis subsp. pomaceae ATCC 29192]MDX5948910.1 pseudouridine synthase [Zymomonas mobilis subsp. pomaceae]GEB88716.1 pseudouridine synthase [Zymomonas mobilis subsp. pomaceae]
MVFNRPPKSGKGRPHSSSRPDRGKTGSENKRTLSAKTPNKTGRVFSKNAPHKGYKSPDKPYGRPTRNPSESYTEGRRENRNFHKNAESHPSDRVSDRGDFQRDGGSSRPRSFADANRSHKNEYARGNSAHYSLKNARNDSRDDRRRGDKPASREDRDYRDSASRNKYSRSGNPQDRNTRRDNGYAASQQPTDQRRPSFRDKDNRQGGYAADRRSPRFSNQERSESFRDRPRRFEENNRFDRDREPLGERPRYSQGRDRTGSDRNNFSPRDRNFRAQPPRDREASSYGEPHRYKAERPEGYRNYDRSRDNRSQDSERRFGSDRPRNRNLAVNPSYSPDARPFKKRGNTEPASARKPRENGPQRIAKLLSRAGIASRRTVERMIEEGRIALDGVKIETPATLMTSLTGVTVDGKSVSAPTTTRLFCYHKATGLLTTERDPEGRPTIYDSLPPDLPRVMPVGRLDMNTEGLLLLTTNGGFKRALELPATHIERCYRARVFGDVSQDQLEELIEGVTIDGVQYGSIDANLERRTGRNGWVELKLHEGRNREVRRVLGYLGLQVSRLIRISYGPFMLGDLPVGAIEEVDAGSLIAFQASLPEKS